MWMVARAETDPFFRSSLSLTDGTFPNTVSHVLPLTELLSSTEGRNRFVLRLPYLPQQGSSLRAGRQQGPHGCSVRHPTYLMFSIQIFRFANSKNESLFLQRKNPRKIAWTQVYRRMHKKGITEEVAKKRSRRTVKHQRGIVGADLAAIQARRNQSAQVRLAQRTAAIQKAKAEKKRKREDGEGKNSSKDRRKKLRSLPTFASYEDYAKLIEDGPEDNI